MLNFAVVTIDPLMLNDLIVIIRVLTYHNLEDLIRRSRAWKLILEVSGKDLPILTCRVSLLKMLKKLNISLIVKSLEEHYELDFLKDLNINLIPYVEHVVHMHDYVDKYREAALPLMHNVLENLAVLEKFERVYMYLPLTFHVLNKNVLDIMSSIPFIKDLLNILNKLSIDQVLVLDFYA